MEPTCLPNNDTEFMGYNEELPSGTQIIYGFFQLATFDC